MQLNENTPQNAVNSQFPRSEETTEKHEQRNLPHHSANGTRATPSEIGRSVEALEREISRRLERVRKALGADQLDGNICCPAHLDDSPSLSVDVEEGKVLLHCHAGCDPQDIVDAVGLEWSDLFPGDANWDISDRGVTETRYTYEDANGDPTFDVVRYQVIERGHPACGQKKFMQQAYMPHHADAGKKGCPDGYVWGRKRHDVPAALYRLPKVREAVYEEHPVFLVEGEKDVHTLEQRGFVATTNPQGAGKWKKKFTEQLKGANVYILPDNDKPGQEHAETVANSLSGVAQSVHVLNLPSLPEKGDVTDWLAGEHDPEELRALMTETREWIPQGQGELELDGGTTRPGIDVFWKIEKGKLKIERSALLRFLERKGFGKLYVQSDLNSMLVRVEKQVVRRTSIERVKDSVFNYIRDLPDENGLPLEHEGQVIFDKDRTPEDVEDALLRGANIYFSSSLFECLPPLDLDFHSDTKSTAYFYYQNGFVEVTNEGFELRPYSDLEGVIWEDQIIDRVFEDLKVENNPTKWDWGGFLWNVSGRDSSRHDALRTSIGYLLHGYKDPALAKAIAFVDEKISDVPSGRSGKSLVGEAVSHVVPAVRVDAKNFSFDSRFRFQDIEQDTQVLEFNDAPKKFPFERLFSAITDDMQREKKGKDSVTIPFRDSPKFLLSTNYVIEGEGSSFEDRIFQFEFHPHYDADHRPVDDFDGRFFEEWSPEQWARFDNIMMYCVYLYLKEGLFEYRHVNLRDRRLRQETSPDFAEWIKAKRPDWYDKKALFKSFVDAYEGDYERLTQRKFTRWCNKYGRIFTGDSLPAKKSGADRYIQLPES